MVFALDLHSVQRSKNLVHCMVPRCRRDQDLWTARTKAEGSTSFSQHDRIMHTDRVFVRAVHATSHATYEDAIPAGSHGHHPHRALRICRLRVADEVHRVCLRVHSSRHIVAISHPFGVVHTARHTSTDASKPLRERPPPRNRANPIRIGPKAEAASSRRAARPVWACPDRSRVASAANFFGRPASAGNVSALRREPDRCRISKM